jgi:hypothetical protein
MNEKPWEYKTLAWPWECSLDRRDGSALGMEDLYQAFKQRLMAELVAENPGSSSQLSADFNIPPQRFPIVSKDRK